MKTLHPFDVLFIDSWGHSTTTWAKFYPILTTYPLERTIVDNLHTTWVLYMSSDKFLLAVESRDLSQADKSIIRVSSFPDMSDG